MAGRRRGNRYLQHPLVRGFILPAAAVAATVLTATAASAEDGADDGVAAPATLAESVVGQDTDGEMGRATDPHSAQQLTGTADPPSVGQPATALGPDDDAGSRMTAPAAQQASSEAAPPPYDPEPFPAVAGDRPLRSVEPAVRETAEAVTRPLGRTAQPLAPVLDHVTNIVTPLPDRTTRALAPALHHATRAVDSRLAQTTQVLTSVLDRTSQPVARDSGGLPAVDPTARLGVAPADPPDARLLPGMPAAAPMDQPASPVHRPGVAEPLRSHVSALVKPPVPPAGRWGISNHPGSVTEFGISTDGQTSAGSALLLLLAVLAAVVPRRTRGVPQAALAASSGLTGRGARVNIRPG